MMLPLVNDGVLFLEDCRCFVHSSLSAEKQHFIVKLIRTGGGTKFADLTDSVWALNLTDTRSTHWCR
jgi:hypothetical protein